MINQRTLGKPLFSVVLAETGYLESHAVPCRVSVLSLVIMKSFSEG